MRLRSSLILCATSCASLAYSATMPPAPVPPAKARSAAAAPTAYQSSQDSESRLQSLVEEGRLRPATQTDIDRLLVIWRRLRSEPRSEPIGWKHGLNHTYVALKPFSRPPRMFGAHSARFLLAPGVTPPADEGSHNTYISLATGACTEAAGKSCASDYPWLVKPLPGVTMRNCPEGYHGSRLDEPIPTGPARLVEISCLPFTLADGLPNRVSVSPDGRMVAGLYGNRPQEVLIADAVSGSLTKVSNPSTVDDISGSGKELPPFTWDPGSRSLCDLPSV